MVNEPQVSHVSDTARWVAAHRAAESRRSDALFTDPFADLLAGDRGRELAAAASADIADDWFFVTRTMQIDEHIMAALTAGCEQVINLGAGLDARPYRLVLPAALRWIEVDLPELIAEKSALLADEQPSCQLARVAVDITDRAAVEAFLDRAVQARSTLVISEGLVMYLGETEVLNLAATLRRPQIVGWCLDVSSSGVATLIADRNQGLLARAPWRFLPANGVGFFEDAGWSVAHVESILDGADRLGRLRTPELRAAAALPSPDPRAPGSAPYSAVTLLRPDSTYQPPS